MAGWVDDLGDGVRKVIRAFHGSPYDFDKFDASMIGSGEGAQSYGHGLYFAGNESVANGYRQRLSGAYRDMQPSAEDIEKYFAPGNIVEGYGGRDKVLQFFPNKDEPWNWRVQVISVDDAGNPIQWERPRTHHTSPSMAKVDKFLGREPSRPGHSYEVEIGHPEEALLDWDKPMGRGVAKRLTPSLRQGLERGVRGRLDMGQLDRHAESLRAMLDDPSLAPGQVLHEGLVSDLGSVGAARSMTNAGIPGIRYLDAGSRRAGDGTRNYVIFPGAEDAIKIIRKYGWMLPATMAAGAAVDGQPVNR